MAPSTELIRQGGGHHRNSSSPRVPPGTTGNYGIDLEAINNLADLNDTGGGDGNGAREVEVGLWVLVCLSALFLGLRVYCKAVNPHSRFRWEDSVVGAAWLMLVANAALTTRLIIIGLGSPSFMLTPGNIDTFMILSLSSITTGIVGQAWSKTSFAMTLLRMTEGWLHWLVWVAIVSLNTLFGVLAVLFWVGCNPVQKKWRPLIPGKCEQDALDRAATFGIYISGLTEVYSGFLDVVFALLPWPLLMNMSKGPQSLVLHKKEKIGIAIAMSMGLFAGITAFVKASYYTSFYHPSVNLDEDLGKLTVWSAAETATTIMASSIPVLRVLVRDLATTEAHRLYRVASTRLSKLSWSSKPSSHTKRLPEPP